MPELDRLPTDALLRAFDADGYDVVDQIEREGFRGLLAESKTAFNANTTEKKRAYYLEGPPFTLGWLMGRMAEPQVAVMTEHFLPNIIPALIDQAKVQSAGRFTWLMDLLVDLIGRLDDGMEKDLPPDQVEEMKGIVAGCKAANPDTEVSFERVFSLNVGIDYLLSIVWSPEKLLDLGIEPEELRTPLMCNAFSAWGPATKEGTHYFGRDFMFPSADSFQFVAAMVLIHPMGSGSKAHQPLVSMTAPGFVGSIAAMNTTGIAAGVDMLPAANVNNDRPGFNSLGLVRHAIEHAISAEQAVDRIVEAHRGVSWLYPISDGANDRAVTVEAGAWTENLDPLSYVSEGWKRLLPTQEELKADPIVIRKGAAIRWDDYTFPVAFLNFNEALFEKKDLRYDPAIFEEHGTPGKNIEGQPFPESYFFSPQLTPQEGLHVSGNTYISPAMRLCSMHWSTVMVGSDQWNDLQWRYDILVWLLHQHYGQIDAGKARELIDFLALDGLYPEYYWWDGSKPEDWRKQRIDGCVSLFDCTHKTVTSHWGNYGDAWVDLTVSAYFPAPPTPGGP